MVLLHAKGDDDVFGRNQIPFHVRQRRRVPGLRTHVGLYDAISLLTGIRFDLYTLVQAAASGSAGMSRGVAFRICLTSDSLLPGSKQIDSTRWPEKLTSGGHVGRVWRMLGGS
jgi:hypothetical protein